MEEDPWETENLAEFAARYNEIEEALLDSREQSDFEGVTDIFDQLLPFFSRSIAQFLKMIDTWNSMTATLGELQKKQSKG